METPLLPPLTILVVEDETGFANALAVLLRRDGHTVETAANGRVALEQVHARQYDLILCDLHLPELDGPALYQRLQTDVSDLHQRVIFSPGIRSILRLSSSLSTITSCGSPSPAGPRRCEKS